MGSSYKLGPQKSNRFEGPFAGSWHLDRVAKIIISVKNSLLGAERKASAQFRENRLKKEKIGVF
jgi:hypothetical protein